MTAGKLDLQPFKELVARRCGLMFDGQAEANLAAALAKRMDSCGVALPAAYYAGLIASDDEFREFVALLTVNETYFFREPSQLALLTDCLVPRLLSRRTSPKPVRILSAGCSTGEEPYSIAIALKEKFGESTSRLFSIVGADIDHRALARAEHAEYGEFSFRALSPERRERYFSGCGPGRYSLDDAIRDMVELRSLNLLEAPYPPALTGFDVVFFRNVSIYFDAPTRKAILGHLHAAMEEGGALVVGASETMANDFGMFRLMEDEGRFYFVKAADGASSREQAGTTVAPLPRPRPAEAAKTITPPPRRRGVEDPRPAQRQVVANAPDPWPAGLDSVRLALREKRHEDALTAVLALCDTVSGDLRPRLLEGFVHLQMRRFSEAAAIAANAAEQDAWSAEAHMLLGLAAKWRADPDTAIGAFRRVAYSRPECWPAHYYLATMVQDHDPARARREYAIALRQITANPDPDGGLALPLDLPVADIRFLCERRAALELAQAGVDRGA